MAGEKQSHMPCDKGYTHHQSLHSMKVIMVSEMCTHMYASGCSSTLLTERTYS